MYRVDVQATNYCSHHGYDDRALALRDTACRALGGHWVPVDGHFDSRWACPKGSLRCSATPRQRLRALGETTSRTVPPIEIWNDESPL